MISSIRMSAFSAARWAGFALLGASAGCLDPGALVTPFLNPDFASSIGLTQGAASIPGEAPAVLVAVENATGRVVEALVSWRDSEDQVVSRTVVIPVDGEVQETVVCPVSELTLGDVGNLRAVGAIVRLGNGGANDPIVEVEAFGVLLQEGVNYDCGDEVAFRVQPSSATLSGYQVFAYIRRSGAND